MLVQYSTEAVECYDSLYVHDSIACTWVVCCGYKVIKILAKLLHWLLSLQCKPFTPPKDRNGNKHHRKTGSGHSNSVKEFLHTSSASGYCGYCKPLLILCSTCIALGL